MLALALALAMPGCGGGGGSDTRETSPTGALAGVGGAGGGAGGANGTAAASGAAGAASFPLRTWTTCAQGTYTPPSGSNFLNAAGFQSGATLTIAKGAAGLSVSYVDQNGAAVALAFHELAGDVAALAGPATMKPDSGALCVLGTGLSSSYPTTLTVTTGMLTYGGGTVFAVLGGTLTADAGPCGSAQSQGYVWILCEDGPSPPATSTAPSPPAVLSVGNYTCTSQAETYYEYQGQKQFLTAGAETGKLALSQSGAAVTADYANDKFVSGSLSLTLTTATTAVASASQSLTARCDVPVGTGSVAPAPLPLAFGALVLDRATLVLAFAGTMPGGSSCAGAKKAGTLVCAKDLNPLRRSSVKRAPRTGLERVTEAGSVLG